MPTFTTLDFPGAIDTQIFDINNKGEIAGAYSTPDLHGSPRFDESSIPMYQPSEREASRSRLDQTRYWVGAAITAAIAAVTAVLGTIIAHSILHIPVLSDGTGATHTLAYALSAAGIAIAAAGLYNAMLHFAPRPRAFFGALSGALIALAVLVPFAITLPLGTQAAFALMNLAVAVVIAILVPLAATNARR